MSARRAAAALAGAAALVAATGCGGDGGGSPSAVQAPTTAVNPATVPTTTTPPAVDTNPTATTGEPVGGGHPGGGQTTTTTTTGGGESGPGGAGDEEPARVPVQLTTAGATLSPSVVTIPAFLAVEISVTAKGGAEKVTVAAPGGGTLTVGAGRTATLRLKGLHPGDYGVTTASGGKTVLRVVAGGAPGP